jgi:hypothetical protein
MIDRMAARQTDRESFDFRYEIQAPSDAPDLSTNKVLLVTNDSEGTDQLGSVKRRDEKFVYYANSTIIFRDNRRYLSVQVTEDLWLVYELHIPKLARPAPFTEWLNADYVATSDVSWGLMNNTFSLSRYTPDKPAIKMRYEVVKDDFSLYEATKKIQK